MVDNLNIEQIITCLIPEQYPNPFKPKELRQYLFAILNIIRIASLCANYTCSSDGLHNLFLRLALSNPSQYLMHFRLYHGCCALQKDLVKVRKSCSVLLVLLIWCEQLDISNDLTFC